MKKTLCEAALKARENAYCPYSRFMVGAAVLGENGKIYTGCNIENASYGMTVCAERVALFTMVADGCRKFKALAVAGSGKEDSAPCLACRQVMTEFCADMDVPVYVTNPDGDIFTHTMQEICPYPFMAFDPSADYHK